MSEETRVTVWEHHHVRGALLWAGFMVTVIVLAIVGYAMFLVRQYIIVVGYVWLVSLVLLPSLAIVFVVTWLVKYIFQVEVTELGPSGNVFRWFGRVTEYHPLGLKDHRVRVKELKPENLCCSWQIPLRENGNHGLLHLPSIARRGRGLCL